TQAGLACLLASWALYWGPEEERRELWDSLRLFLAVVGAFILLAAPLVAASTPVRRLGVSVLIVLHLAGVATVVIGSPPGPWAAAQLQHWVFRPYLDFMYLNNAYRFYAPEPGPASQVWFRVEYQHGNQTLTRWVKLPEMDDRGHHRYPMSLQYTRRL